MTPKLLVEQVGKGSRVSLLGARGQPLMTSPIFTEPRAKGAAVRSISRLMGEKVTVEDHTTARARRATAPNGTG